MAAHKHRQTSGTPASDEKDRFFEAVDLKLPPKTYDWMCREFDHHKSKRRRLHDLLGLRHYLHDRGIPLHRHMNEELKPLLPVWDYLTYRKTYYHTTDPDKILEGVRKMRRYAPRFEEWEEQARTELKGVISDEKLHEAGVTLLASAKAVDALAAAKKETGAIRMGNVLDLMEVPKSRQYDVPLATALKNMAANWVNRYKNWRSPRE